MAGDGLCSSTSMPWRHAVYIFNLALPPTYVLAGSPSLILCYVNAMSKLQLMP